MDRGVPFTSAPDMRKGAKLISSGRNVYSRCMYAPFLAGAKICNYMQINPNFLTTYSTGGVSYYIVLRPNSITTFYKYSEKNVPRVPPEQEKI